MKNFIIEVIILLGLVLLFKWNGAPDYIALISAIIIVNLWEVKNNLSIKER